MRSIARTIAAERLTLEIAQLLDSKGIDHCVLKGAVFAEWLPPSSDERLYGDVDLLIAPNDFDRTERLLADKGFERFWDVDFEGKKPWTAKHWVRHDDDAHIDLHRSLAGVMVPPERLWESLCTHRDSLTLRGNRLRTLDEVANALHVALHAAQHGVRHEKTLRDLEWALLRLPRAKWFEAAALAEELGAKESFALGLKMKDEGIVLAKELGLPEGAALDAIVRAQSAPMIAETLVWLKGLSWPARTSYLMKTAFPSPRSMRTRSLLAKRGTVGLLIAYPLRWVWLMGRLPRALRALAEAKRALRPRQ